LGFVNLDSYTLTSGFTICQGGNDCNLLHYIFGIGISPYASQYYNLTGIDTLANAKTLAGSGGINSLHVSFGQSSGRKENFALAFDFLFGSSRMKAKPST